MKNSFFPIFICILFSLAFFSSCSVKFDETPSVEDVVPEFVFKDLSLKRYENKNLTTEVYAEEIERYKDSSEIFAKDVGFKVYDKNGKPDTEGQCGYLYADTGKEFYELYDDIQVHNNTEKTSFYAEQLRWDAKTEQLTAGKDDVVRVERNGAEITGSGFSASGVSKTYVFTSRVTGEIETDD